MLSPIIASSSEVPTTANGYDEASEPDTITRSRPLARTGRTADPAGSLVTLVSGQAIEERVADERTTGKITVAFDQDDQRTTKPTVIDHARHRPTLGLEMIVSGDDEGLKKSKVWLAVDF